MNAFTRLLSRQVLKRTPVGSFVKPTRAQALLRLPTLLRLGYALLRDDRIPLWQRGTVVGLLGLVFSPIDVLGDIPIVGQVWDFTMAVVILEAFINYTPAHIVNEHIIRLGLEGKFPPRTP